MSAPSLLFIPFHHEELKLLVATMESGVDNLLHFPFGFAIDDVRWWSFVVWPVSFCLAVSGQQVYMKNRVDLHWWRERQAVCHGGQLLIDEERSVSARR